MMLLVFIFKAILMYRMSHKSSPVSNLNTSGTAYPSKINKTLSKSVVPQLLKGTSRIKLVNENKNGKSSNMNQLLSICEQC